MVVFISRVSLGLYSSRDIASTTVLCVPLMYTISGAYSSNSNLHWCTLFEVKPKARLCAHGGMQTWGQNYWETYAPVVNWASVRLILAIAKIHGLSSKSIDFVLAFPQADLEIPVYMDSYIHTFFLVRRS